MYPHDSLQSECLSLVAGLYGAAADPDRFADRRASCEEWLSRQISAESPAAAFLRSQMCRAAEALALTARMRMDVPSACAVLILDSQGRVIAAGPEAWTLLRSGSPDEDPLRLPRALQAFVEDVCISQVVPKALRVPLEDGSSELAGVVLGVDRVCHALGAMQVITLLLYDVGAGGRSRGEVREFRRRNTVTGPRPVSVTLAVERPA